MLTRAVDVLVAKAATSHNQNFVPSRLAEARSEIPQGKPTLLMQPQPLSAVHPFTPTLNKWRHGIEVDCGPDWSWDVVEAAIARRPHPTASTPDSIALFKEDIVYCCGGTSSTCAHRTSKSCRLRLCLRLADGDKLSWTCRSRCIKMSMEWSQPCKLVSTTPRSHSPVDPSKGNWEGATAAVALYA